MNNVDNLPIALRAYVCKESSVNNIPKYNNKAIRKPSLPSEWSLIFDTETTTDETQKLRFGTYQVRKNDSLIEKGSFYDEQTLNQGEIETLKQYSERNKLKLITKDEFIEDVFYRVGYLYRATIIGFNLPFDISRLAIDHSPARSTPRNKIMRGGFSFKLSENPEFPRVQIKHVSSRDAFIQFAATKGQRTSRGNRKKKRYQPIRRGYFIDVKTLAAALTSQSHSLNSLANALKVEAQKHSTEEHGLILTEQYIDYAVQDTQTTWECYKSLKSLYELHGLEHTFAHNIHSEASLGKAYLKEMGVKPWREVQTDFPNDLLGIIMSTYYGGRSEVHIRREITQVLYCDFLSMYPTVCTLMNLWRFVTAKGMDWSDTTQGTKNLLENVKLIDLQNTETWENLSTLVQVKPDKDIFPVRAKYGGDSQYTIGLNFLTNEQAQWFTLADCISSKLLTGKTPEIIKAITFKPQEIQNDLEAVCVAGKKDYLVNPNDGDFFKNIIDLRQSVKNKMKNADIKEKQDLNQQQQALKILANATSYGIFVELNVEEDKNNQVLLCHGYNGQPINLNRKKYETAGKFFHPLLASLITGAARLKLAITEKLATDYKLDWAFCDTDSMALAKPKNMNENEFLTKARFVQEWFTPLNPYTHKAPLLKIEDDNYSLSQTDNLDALFCYAVSSKRYALFNLQNGKVILRKVSAHGLGHLITPYRESVKSNLKDTQPWQQDLWAEIIESELRNEHPNFSTLKNFNKPAISRYNATTPQLERWFKDYNQDKPYEDRVRPFNFLLSMQANPHLKNLKPISPFNTDYDDAVNNCFDRNTGKKVSKKELKTNLDALAQYHLHPEAKFLDANFLDKGITKRRHIIATSIQHIGKEANKWEEQFFTGYNAEAQLQYGACPHKKAEIENYLINAIKKCGTGLFAKYSNLSQKHILNILNRNIPISEKSFLKLIKAMQVIDNKESYKNKLIAEIKDFIKNNNYSIRKIANKLNLDPSNLSKILSGKRDNLKTLKSVHTYINSI